MIIDKALRRKIIAICIAFVAVIILAVLVQQQSYSFSSIPTEYDDQRGEDAAGDEVSSLYLRNPDEFQQTFPASIQTSILNTIYHKNYELYGTIDRVAEMKGGVSNAAEGYLTFTLLMGESKHPVYVKIKVENSATNNYTMSVEKEKS